LAGLIERYLGRAFSKLPAGAGSSLLHVVGGDMGGGYEWQAAPAYRASVRRGISAITNQLISNYNLSALVPLRAFSVYG